MATNKQYEKAQNLTDVDDGRKEDEFITWEKLQSTSHIACSSQQQSGLETSTRMKRKLSASPDPTGGLHAEALVINEADRQKNYIRAHTFPYFPFANMGSLQLSGTKNFFFQTWERISSFLTGLQK